MLNKSSFIFQVDSFFTWPSKGANDTFCREFPSLFVRNMSSTKSVVFDCDLVERAILKCVGKELGIDVGRADGLGI